MLTGRNPGDLRHEVTIQAVTYAQTDTGEAQEVFTDWVTVPAKIQSTSGKEFFGSQQVMAEVTNVVSIRYVEPDTDHPNGVEPKMWVVFGNRRFNILYVNDPYEDRQIWLDLLCRELIGAPGLPDQN